jgi:hypothetical protein
MSHCQGQWQETGGGWKPLQLGEETPLPGARGSCSPVWLSCALCLVAQGLCPLHTCQVLWLWEFQHLLFPLLSLCLWLPSVTVPNSPSPGSPPALCGTRLGQEAPQPISTAGSLFLAIPAEGFLFGATIPKGREACGLQLPEKTQTLS